MSLFNERKSNIIRLNSLSVEEKNSNNTNDLSNNFDFYNLSKNPREDDNYSNYSLKI